MRKALLAGLIIMVTVAAAAIFTGSRKRVAGGGIPREAPTPVVTEAENSAAQAETPGDASQAAGTGQTAEEAGSAGGSLAGKDFVALGQLGSLAGLLETEAGEWYLRVGEERYALHLGNQNYQETIALSLNADREAKVSGFIYQLDVTVVTLSTEGREYRFRGEDGRPIWAGQGQGRNKQ